MASTNNNCVELTFDRTGLLEDHEAANSIDWRIESAIYAGSSTFSPIEGSLAPNETTALACLDDDNDDIPIKCAFVEATVSWKDGQQQQQQGGSTRIIEEGNVRVVWDDIVWAHKYFKIGVFDEKPLVWFGNECHDYLYQVCHQYNEKAWLLDVQLTTTSETTDDSIYWRIYSDFGGGSRGNLLHDPYFRRYQPNTTYRTLHCIDDDSITEGGCTEFGLSSTVLPDDYTIRVNGQEKTERWNCSDPHLLCENDIVTPLKNCSSEDGLSNGAIAGIAIAIVVVVVAAVIGIVLFIRHNDGNTQKESSATKDDDAEQPLEEAAAGV